MFRLDLKRVITWNRNSMGITLKKENTHSNPKEYIRNESPMNPNRKTSKSKIVDCFNRNLSILKFFSNKNFGTEKTIAIRTRPKRERI